MVSRPEKTTGLRHVALFVSEFDSTLDFYIQIVGMSIEWNPDPDNYYLTSGNDNLAIHRYKGESPMTGPQALDHIGFILNAVDHVDDWYAYLVKEGVPMKTSPRTHRDGARSFYCFDPDGNTVQFIYHPPLVIMTQE